MALPSNDKIIGDLGHTDDHNAIVSEIAYIKDNYYSASSTSINLTQYLKLDVASATYVTKFSASLSGIPTAPTAITGTNTKQIATTEFVRTEVSNLINSAPSTLDTLNELAQALGNDANYAATTASILSNKLNSSTASAIYLSKSDASNLYYLKSASGIFLTEDEAIATYIPISASSSIAPIGYLKESVASATYLSQSNAEQIYLTQQNASATYLSQSNAEQIYLTISSSNNYAARVSPNFSGIPTAPTASPTDISNQIATTEFVKSSILAAQTGSAVDLSIYLTKLSASIIYAPLISPVFSGSVTGQQFIGKIDYSDILNAPAASVNWINIIDKPDPIIGINLLGDVTGAASVTITDLNSSQISINTSLIDLGYLSRNSASALYVGFDSVINCGGP